MPAPVSVPRPPADGYRFARPVIVKTLTLRGRDAGLGAQGVTDPAQPQVIDVLDALDGAQGCPSRLDELWVDSVHQSGTNLSDRGPKNAKDRDSDDKPDYRLSPVPAQGDTTRAQQHSETGEAICSGVQSVSDHGRRTDPRPTWVR